MQKLKHDISWFYQKNGFKNIKIKINYKDLNDSGVLTSDFSGLIISAVSMTSTASVASMTSAASFYNGGVKNDPQKSDIIPGRSLSSKFKVRWKHFENYTGVYFIWSVFTVLFFFIFQTKNCSCYILEVFLVTRYFS